MRRAGAGSRETTPRPRRRSRVAPIRGTISCREIFSRRALQGYMTPLPIHLYIDADACPVKQEIYRVAERFVARGTALKVIVVANSPIAVPRADFIARAVVGS